MCRDLVIDHMVMYVIWLCLDGWLDILAYVLARENELGLLNARSILSFSTTVAFGCCFPPYFL